MHTVFLTIGQLHGKVRQSHKFNYLYVIASVDMRATV